eukprot:1195103-Prorocentrum_minimum.AAC.2
MARRTTAYPRNIICRSIATIPDRRSSAHIVQELLVYLLDIQQLNVEDQGGVGRNSASYALPAVTALGPKPNNLLGELSHYQVKLLWK